MNMCGTAVNEWQLIQLCFIIYQESKLPVMKNGASYCSSLSLCQLSWTDVSSDSSLHKILRKRDGNVLLNSIITLLVFWKCPFILLPYCASIQWQELVLPPQSPPLPSPLPRPKSSWQNWAEPRGTFGIAAEQTYSSGLRSLCTWDLTSRWVDFCSRRVQVSSELLKSFNKNRNQSQVALWTWQGVCKTKLIHITKTAHRFTTSWERTLSMRNKRKRNRNKMSLTSPALTKNSCLVCLLSTADLLKYRNKI